MLYALFMPALVVLVAIPVAILGFIGIWSLPESRAAPTAPLVILFFAFVVALVLWPNYLGLDLKGLPWVTAIRLTGIPLAFCFLICVSISEDFRTKIAVALKDTPWIWRLMLAFIAVQFVTIGFSRALTTSAQKVILYQINWTAIFFVSCYIFQRRGRVEWWAALLLVMIIPVGIIAFWESKLQQLPWFGHIPKFLSIEDPSVILDLTPKMRANAYRARSTFGTPLGLAEYIAITLPFALHFVVEKFPLLVRLLAAALIPFMFAVSLSTNARLGMVGFLAGTSLYVLLFGIIQWRRSPTNLLGPAIVLTYPVMFVGAVLSTFLVGRIRQKIWGSGLAYESSSTGRLTQYKSGIPHVISHPWGFGAGQAGIILNFLNPNGTRTIDTYWLVIAMDYGIVGFILYYSTIGAAAYYAARYGIEGERDGDREISFLIPIACALSTFFVIKAVFAEPDNHPLIYMMMGIVVVLVNRLLTRRRDAARAAEAAVLAQRHEIPEPPRRIRPRRTSRIPSI